MSKPKGASSSSPLIASATPPLITSMMPSRRHDGASSPAMIENASTTVGVHALSIWTNETLRWSMASLPVHRLPAKSSAVGTTSVRTLHGASVASTNPAARSAAAIAELAPMCRLVRQRGSGKPP